MTEGHSIKLIVCLVAIAFLATSCGGGLRGGRDDGQRVALVGPLEPTDPAVVAGAAPGARREPEAAPDAGEQKKGESVVLARAISPARAVARWTSYKQFVFDREKSELQPSDSGKVSEIAAYMARNPSLHVGLDGSDTRDPALSSLRVAALRDALVQAGVASSRIETGAFGGQRIKRDRGVEVLLVNR